MLSAPSVSVPVYPPLTVTGLPEASTSWNAPTSTAPFGLDALDAVAFCAVSVTLPT